MVSLRFMNHRTAFSLIELSIVLVILGLLTGGILAGRSLIRASELRAVMTESDRFRTAGHAFRDKYMALPGDMTNATAFWGKNATYCNGHPGVATVSGTCNGDGSGRITSNGGTLNQTVEQLQVWNQLALAGLITGMYSGISGSSVFYVPEVNLPASKLAKASWTWMYVNYLPSGDTWNFAYDVGNRLRIHDHITGGGVLRAEEAWNIDTKLDDGQPGTGKIIGVLRNNCTNASSATDYSTVYRLTSTSLTACSLDWRNAI